MRKKWAALILGILCYGSNGQSDYTQNKVLVTNEDSGTFLGPEDFQGLSSIQRDVSNEEGSDESNINPLTMAGLFEGDIKGYDEMESHEGMPDSHEVARNAIKNKQQRWPNGIVPYMISSQYGSYERKVIAQAMKEYHAKTCIKFKPRGSEQDYIYIHKDEGCYSYVGRTGGRQDISLVNGCFRGEGGGVGVVIHEFMHALGFFHEQSRADRDDWVDIKWHNIPGGRENNNFAKYTLKDIQHLGAQYDYGSIMHYGDEDFSMYPGRKTIVPKRSGAKIGQRRGFSSIDLYKINKLYECDNGGNGPDSGSSEESGVVRPVPTRKPKPKPRPKPGGPCMDTRLDCVVTYTTGFTESIDCRSLIGMTSCRKSCGYCGAETCEDQGFHCIFWTSNNPLLCSIHNEYMMQECPRSCGFCAQERNIIIIGKK